MTRSPAGSAGVWTLSLALLAVPVAANAQAPNVERLPPHEARGKAVQVGGAPTASRAAEYAPMIESAARRNGVPADLVRAVILGQSAYDPRAETSRGARGLMRLMPETASMLGVSDAFDPEQSLEAGARNLRSMLDRFGDDLPLVLTAYAAGEEAAARYGTDIPDTEVRTYVSRALRAYRTALKGAALVPTRSSAGKGQRSDLWRYAEDENTVVYTNIKRPEPRP